MRLRKRAIAIILMGTCSLAMAATIRNGGDPAKERVRWADPFDFYTQYAYDNSQTWVDFRGDPTGTPGPSGGLHNGPYPPGSASGSYPTEAANQGCDTTRQTTPALLEMARAMWTTTSLHKDWLGTGITTPGGLIISTGDFEANMDPHCNASGEIVTTRSSYGRASYTWGTGGSYDAMTMFQHSFKDRLQYIDPTKNAIAGTDANPLVLSFEIIGAQSMVADNFYVELSMDGDHAPTDYVWRGDATKTYPDPDGCPNGPFPVICQQAHEINGSNSEDGGDYTWFVNACPPLSTKTWKSVAFGFLSIMDKDPCAILEQGTDQHIPNVDHWAYFNGNYWRQLRTNRELGLATVTPCWDYAAGTTGCTNCPGVCTGKGGQDPNIQMSGAVNSTGFSYGNGGSNILVTMKVVTNYVMLWVRRTVTETDPNTGLPVVNTYYDGGAFERVWKDNPSDPNARAGFNMVSIGVGPGCELDPATGTCKAGSNKQALTYSRVSNGYHRIDMENFIILDGELVTVETVNGACCQTDGTCSMTQESACNNISGAKFAGVGVSCSTVTCCPKRFGDVNGDGDLDEVDFADLQRCLTTGPGPSGSDLKVTSACSCWDVNSDSEVNSTDVQKFLDCAAGPEVQASLTTLCTGKGW